MRTHYIMLFFFFLSCSSKKEMYQFECSNLNSEGYVELKVSNLINPEKYPLQKAAKDAIKVILFTGYSSVNCQTQKPILNTLQEKENFNKMSELFGIDLKKLKLKKLPEKEDVVIEEPTVETPGVHRTKNNKIKI